MTREELKAAAKTLYGGHGWRKKLAAAFGVAYSTTGHWLNGRVKIPRHVPIEIRAWLKERGEDG